MVALKGSEVKNVKIEDAIARQKLVSPNNQAVRTARAIGISFGE